MNNGKTKPKKLNTAKKPAKSKTDTALHVKAWEKLKGHGPFPQVAVDEDTLKRMKKM